MSSERRGGRRSRSALSSPSTSGTLRRASNSAPGSLSAPRRAPPSLASTAPASLLSSSPGPVSSPASASSSPRALSSSAAAALSPGPAASPASASTSPRAPSSSASAALAPVTPAPPSPAGAQSGRRSSARIRESGQRAVRLLGGLADQTGRPSAGHSSNDLTPFLMLPLDPGGDGRRYTSNRARQGMKRAIKASVQKADRLEDAGLPEEALALRAQAQQRGVGALRVSNRHAGDGFRSGGDWTYTENRGEDHSGTRGRSDTPRPRSPDPHSTGEALTSEIRNEHSHQSAYRFTGQPGTTVHAPTQGNQVADSAHERHVGSSPGSFLVRHDDYYASSIYSARRGSDDTWEVMQSSYSRRKRKQPTADEASPSSSSSSSNSPRSSRSSSSGSSSDAPPAKRAKYKEK
jgi:hypothetical protein